jgi:hypothetical protein
VALCSFADGFAPGIAAFCPTSLTLALDRLGNAAAVLAGCLTDCLTDFLTDCLTGFREGWLADCPDLCLTSCLPSFLPSCLLSGLNPGLAAPRPPALATGLAAAPDAFLAASE